jgi:restriction endonuclease Mrr
MNETPLEHTLKHASLHALLMVTSKALARSGYGDVVILDRRQPRQKSRYGGHELVCQSNLGTVPVKVIVKVINDDIRLRMLDELAGAVDRTQSEIGLIVSPHHLTAGAAAAQEKYRRARIEVIDGPMLAQVLMACNIGIRLSGEVDYAFFEGLEEFSDRMREFIAKVSKEEA